MWENITVRVLAISYEILTRLVVALIFYWSFTEIFGARLYDSSCMIAINIGRRKSSKLYYPDTEKKSTESTMVDYLCKDRETLLQFYKALVTIGRLGWVTSNEFYNSGKYVPFYSVRSLSLPQLAYFFKRQIIRNLEWIQTRVPLTFAFNQTPDTQQSLFINKADPIRLRSNKVT